MTEFEIAVAGFTPAAEVQVEYRAYYDHQGAITAVAAEPLEGDYIVLTREQYDAINPLNYRVVNGELRVLDKSTAHVLQLESSATGEFATLPGNRMFASTDGDRYTIKRA